MDDIDTAPSAEQSASTVPNKRFLSLALLGVLLVVAVAAALTWWRQQQQAAHEGIVYPVNGQFMSGESIELFSTFTLNQLALTESLRTNGEPTILQSISARRINDRATVYQLELNLSDGDVLTLDSQQYNQQKDLLEEQSPVEDYAPLPEDLSWSYSDQEVFIDQISETKDSELTRPQFEARLSGPEEVSDQELLVFSLDMERLIENREDRELQRLVNDCRYSELDRSEFDWSKFQLHDIQVVERSHNSIIFEPAGSWPRDNSCFFVAAQGDASSVSSFYATPRLTPGAELTLEELYNPDQDFKSIISISFQTPYYDTKKQRSTEEEIAYRGPFKRQLADLLSTTPAVNVNPEDITLYAYRALVPLQLEENTHYRIALTEGTDVYGEAFPTQSLEVETGELKYLGLRQQEGQAVFMNTAPPAIDILHYDVNNPTLKLCRVGLESFGKIEQVVSRRNDMPGSEEFLLSGIDQLPVEDCTDQLIELDTDSTRTSVDMTEVLGEPAQPGLYYLTFAFQGERKVSEQSPVSPPLFFSIVDAHISMKLSSNGKALFWVNDLKSGEGIAGLTLRGYQNDFRAFESEYNPDTRDYDYDYADPMSTDIFSNEQILGTTDAQGFLEVDLSRDDYHNAFQSWWNDAEHRSLAVIAEGDEHLSFVVSKWNSGIAGWNFGFAPREWGLSSDFSSHLYTDRKLYKPGETVHFKAIVRQMGRELNIPANSASFRLKLSNPQYEDVFSESITLTDWGTHLRDIEIPEDSPLGSYRLQLTTMNDEGAMDYIGTTEFSVEEFQKPTFKVDVAVNSPDLQDESFTDPEVDESRTPWGYRYKTYTKDLTLKADIMASYYSGGIVPSADFTYTVYKQYYYDNSWWEDCYYGCYWEPYKDYYSEGEGQLEADGTASINIPVTHETSWNDYRYIVEVAVTDQANVRVAGSGSTIVKVPSSLRQSNPYNAVEIEADPQFVAEGEAVTIKLKPERVWDEANNDRYQMVLKRRHYTVKNSKQVGGDILPQVDYEDLEVEQVAVSTDSFTRHDDGSLSREFLLPEDGEYHLSFQEASGGDHHTVRELELYAYDPQGITNAPVVADNKIAVVTEKTSYHLGETARLLVRLPFTDGKALITTEKQSVVDRQLIDIEGNTLLQEFVVDDSYLPNAYISVIAFKPAGESGIQPEYKVGYAEVVVDKTDKKLFIETEADAQTYSPRDTVTLDFSTRDRDDNPVRADLSVAVVDEALIALLGNIDLDILPKFYRKIEFQTHTALTNVAMLKHLYFARKGIIGGSGGKEGGDSIFTRTDFKNTAFYAGSVITDASGQAQLSFDLPDNIGDFRVIVLGHSKNNFFGASEHSIQVRQEVVVEEAFPVIVRRGDEMRVGANVFNNSDEQKGLTVSLDSDGFTTPNNNRQEITVEAGERGFVTWGVRVLDDVKEAVSYTITAGEEASGKGDRIQKTLPVSSSPLIANLIHFQDDFQRESNTELDLLSDIDPAQTRVEMRFSTTILAGVEQILQSLIKYPYGCIEQTISSTMPNAIVARFNDLLDIDISSDELQSNIQAGLKRFASMQVDDGGFAYWEGGRQSEPHITPYVLLSLVQMRDLGVEVPEQMINRAQTYVEKNIRSLSGSITGDRLSQLAHELHALSRLDSNQFANARTLLQNRLSDLTTHERIVYALALAKKNIDNYRSEIAEIIDGIDLSQAGNSRNWYWDKTADKALFAQLLMRFDPEHEDIAPLIKELYRINWASYYYSTQAKIQSFIAFTDYIEKIDQGRDTVSINYRLGEKSGRVRLSDRNILSKQSFTLDEFWESGPLDFRADVVGDGDARVYSDLVIYQIPQDPSTIAPQQDKGVTVKREYFRLGDVTEEGDEWWQQAERDLAPVSGNRFRLGETYLVRLTVDFDSAFREVALESYLPAGLKVLNTRFLTEADQVGEQRWNWPFSYQEFRPDRFFASARYYEEYGQATEVEYYVRAIVPGTFREPPVSVYPMYHPEVEAHTAFRQIVVEE